MGFVNDYTIDHGVTQSLLSTFIQCRQMAAYYLQGLRLVRSKESLNIGSMVHQGLEEYYSGKERAVVKPAKAYNSWIEGLAQDCMDADAPDQDAQVAMAKVSAILKPYINYYKEEDGKEFEWVELEKKFDVIWNRYRLLGRRDGIVKVGEDYWLFETKTTSQISDENYQRKLAFDFQVLFYITVAEHELKIPITGVIYNVIRKPSNRQGKNDSFQSFTKRMQDAVEKDPEKFFIRYEAQYNERTKKEFQRELKMKLSMFQDWLEGRLPTYKNESACVGKWACQYLAQCAKDKDCMYENVTKLFEELED